MRVLQSALAVQRPGRYQVEAAIAALHDDAASAEETDWRQILAWYDDLVALTDEPVRQDPAAVLGRAVAVGHVLGADAGLRETDRLRETLGERHRWHAVRGHLHELGGDLPAAASAYAEAARRATDIAERDHLVRQAARARAAEPARTSSLAVAQLAEHACQSEFPVAGLHAPPHRGLDPALRLGGAHALAEQIGVPTEVLGWCERDRIDAVLDGSEPGGWKPGDAVSERADEVGEFGRPAAHG